VAQTPFQDLGSVDILAAHISGLQHAINKIEQILDMRTASVTGHQLNPVTDQDDPALRYRIYEGTIRNWLASPPPVIYRNGQVVPSSEYTVYPAYGVVVFGQQQAPSDVITADFSYITAQSAQLDGMWGMVPLVHRPGLYRANNIQADQLSTNILVAANAIEVIPFPVPERMTFDRIAIKVDTAAASTMARLAIYADNGKCYPGALILDAGEVATDTTGVKEIQINVTLDRGLYWLARNHNGQPSITGVSQTTAIQLGIDGSLSGRPASALRVNYTYGPMPDPYPAGATAQFGTRAAVFLRRA